MLATRHSNATARVHDGSDDENDDDEDNDDDNDGWLLFWCCRRI